MGENLIQKNVKKCKNSGKCKNVKNTKMWKIQKIWKFEEERKILKISKKNSKE